MEVIIALVILFLIVAVPISIRADRKAERAFAEHFDTLTERLSRDHPNARTHICREDGTYIAIDFDVATVVFGQARPPSKDTASGETSETSVSFRDLVKVEILRDGDTVSSIDRATFAGGAALGGLVFGGAGAIVGALAGSRKTKQKVRQISIRATVEDVDRPFQSVTTFLWTKNMRGVVSSDPAVKEKAEQTEVIAANLETAMRRAAKAPAEPGRSKGAEIAELNELRTSGAISQDEFDKLKAEVLAPA